MKTLSKIWKLVIAIAILVIIYLGVGLPLYFALDNSIVLIVCGFNFAIIIGMYICTNYYYINHDDQSKKKILMLTTALRYIFMFLSLGLTYLYLYLTSNTDLPNIFYILLAPLMLGIGYLLGVLIK